MMQETEVYRLEVNGRLLARVLVEGPAWLPVSPRIPDRSAWLRQFVASMLSFLCGS